MSNMRNGFGISKCRGDKSEVTLSESQIELANITVQRVTVQEIGNSILLNGRLRADETQTEVVSSRVPGRIDKLFIKETGVPINQGQLIYEIYSEQLLTYQNEYLLALAQSQSIDNKRYSSYGSFKEEVMVVWNDGTSD